MSPVNIVPHFHRVSESFIHIHMRVNQEFKIKEHGSNSFHDRESPEAIMAAWHMQRFRAVESDGAHDSDEVWGLDTRPAPRLLRSHAVVRPIAPVQC